MSKKDQTLEETIIAATEATLVAEAVKAIFDATSLMPVADLTCEELIELAEIIKDLEE